MDSLALDAALWDLDVDAHGDWRTVGDATPEPPDVGPGQRLAQDVATRCMAWRGEVYFDTAQGIRYEQLLGGPPNMAVIQNAFQTEALLVPECATALPALVFNARTRRLTGDITVADVNGFGGSVVL